MTRRILTDFVIDKIAAVDRPCQEGATVSIIKRAFSDKKREDLAETGQAEDDGSYPIESKKDVENAVQSFGRSKNKKKTKAHIISEAKKIGAESSLPDGWMKKFEIASFADDLAKNFFMLMPQQDEEEKPEDFNSAFDDVMTERANAQNYSDLVDCLDALRCSLKSICESDLSGPDRMLAVRNSVGQFLDHVQAKMPGAPEDMASTAQAADASNMIAIKRLSMLKANVLKVKTNEMLESVESISTATMPRQRRIPRNSQPMVRAGSKEINEQDSGQATGKRIPGEDIDKYWSDAAREAAAEARKAKAGHEDKAKEHHDAAHDYKDQRSNAKDQGKGHGVPYEKAIESHTRAEQWHHDAAHEYGHAEKAYGRGDMEEGNRAMKRASLSHASANVSSDNAHRMDAKFKEKLKVKKQLEDLSSIAKAMLLEGFDGPPNKSKKPKKTKA
jgi:hypothetical protein